MVNHKNKSQTSELKVYLISRLQQMKNKVEELHAELEKQGFSVELLRQINIVEYNILVCEKRLSGKIDNPRFKFELAIPKELHKI